MNSTSHLHSPSHQSYPYPLVRSGALFLLLIGLGIVIDIVLSGAFIVGTVFAILSLMFAKVLSFGKPKRIQIIALFLAVILEIVLLIILVNVLPADIAERVRLMWILMIVGVHFLPMAISFGPKFGALGILCIVNALAGLLLSSLPREPFLLIDGALKVGFGIWLFKRPSNYLQKKSFKNS